MLDGPETVNVGALTASGMITEAIAFTDFPVTVSVLLPTTALELAETIRDAVCVTGLGKNEAVTPLGSPVIARLTLSSKPYIGMTYTYCGCADVPWPTVIVPSLCSVNRGTNTPRVTVVVRVMLPDVPVIVNVALPRAAVELAERVRLESCDCVAGFGAKEAVTPLGRPEMDKVTLPVKPNCGLTPMPRVSDLPWPIFTLAGAFRVKVGAATVTERVVVTF